MEYRLIQYWELRRRKEKKQQGLLVLLLGMFSYVLWAYCKAKGIF